jgi:hypothetical protein
MTIAKAKRSAYFANVTCSFTLLNLNFQFQIQPLFIPFSCIGSSHDPPLDLSSYSSGVAA